jgi:hypothetical protein
MKETTVSVICMTVSYMLFSDILMKHGQMPLKNLLKAKTLLAPEFLFIIK